MPYKPDHITAREYDVHALKERDLVRQHEEWAISACEQCGCKDCLDLKEQIKARPR